MTIKKGCLNVFCFSPKALFVSLLAFGSVLLMYLGHNIAIVGIDD